MVIVHQLTSTQPITALENYLSKSSVERGRAATGSRHRWRPDDPHCPSSNLKRLENRLNSPRRQSLAAGDERRQCGKYRHEPEDSENLQSNRNILRIDNRTVHRMQIFADFLDSHSPSASGTEMGRARYISFMANIPAMDISSRMLTGAMDARCLAHLGTSKEDRRLVNASQKSYGCVLANLRNMFATSAPNRPGCRDVVLSMMLIGLFEEALPVDQRTECSSYMTHLWGAQQYVSACNPQRFNFSNRLDRALIHNVFQASFWLGIARRQRVSLTNSTWTQAAFVTGPENTKWFHLYNVIPELLEKADDLLHDTGLQKLLELGRLCQEIETVREMIKRRKAESVSDFRSELVYLSDDSAFDELIEEHCFFRSSTTFQTFRKYFDVEHAVNLSSLTLLYLIMDCTLLRIFHFRPVVRTITNRRSPEEVKRQANELVRQLCESVYSFSLLSSFAYAHWIKVLLTFAQNFFETEGAMREMGWCQACLIATEMRIQRRKADSPPTLCRVGDLPEGLTECARYRLRQIAPGCPSPVKTSATI